MIRTRARTRFALLALTLSMMTTGLVAFADEKLFGVACRSVHLGYTAPKGKTFINEVTVEKSAPGTYFCVGGFNKGYFGMQELGNGRKLVIFSVWDPGQQDDPSTVNEDRRVKLIAKNDKVRVGRFGNEGTGGQSFYNLDWKPGATYRFAVKAKVDGNRTEYAAYLQEPDAKDWTHLITFSTITNGAHLGGYYSFIEDFKRDRVSTTRSRRATFGGGWVETLDDRWVPLTKAQFTGDGNPATNIDAGLVDDRFFLATGGSTLNTTTKLRGSIQRTEARTAPTSKP